MQPVGLWGSSKGTAATLRASLCNCSGQALVDILGEGYYKRYDESTASRMLEMCRKLGDEYGGSLAQLLGQSESRADAERRLQGFHGAGPKAVQILIREAPQVWH